MAHAIRVDSPFVTAEETADILGIPRSRANTLIERARKIASKIAYRNSREGKFVTEARRKSKATTKTRNPLHGGTKTAKSNTSKARR
jgi:hypothetical protein